MASRTFTISNLLWIVLGCAIVQGVILAPNAVTVTLFVLSILGILVTSLLAIAYRRGRRRAAWIGFAAFAWSMAIPMFLAMLDGPRRPFPPEIIVMVTYWTLVPVFGFVGSIVALRLHDTRDAPPSPATTKAPTAHPLDPEPKPQPLEPVDHVR